MRTSRFARNDTVGVRYAALVVVAFGGRTVPAVNTDQKMKNAFEVGPVAFQVGQATTPDGRQE